jgi:hypothetical protein
MDAPKDLTNMVHLKAPRRGQFIIMKARPCKILEICTSKAGCGVKYQVRGRDIITNSMVENVFSDLARPKRLLDNPERLQVEKVTPIWRDMEMLDISDEGLMSWIGDDFGVEEGIEARTVVLAKEIQEYQYWGEEEVLKVTIVEAMGEKKAISAYGEFEMEIVGTSEEGHMMLL